MWGHISIFLIFFNFEPLAFKVILRKYIPREFSLYIVHPKEEKIFFKNLKKFGGDKGVEPGQILLKFDSNQMNWRLNQMADQMKFEDLKTTIFAVFRLSAWIDQQNFHDGTPIWQFVFQSAGFSPQCTAETAKNREISWKITK